MAVKKTVSDVKLQVRLNNGTTSGGNIAIKNINLNNLKLDATEQQLIDAGNAVAALVSSPRRSQTHRRRRPHQRRIIAW